MAQRASNKVRYSRKAEVLRELNAVLKTINAGSVTNQTQHRRYLIGIINDLTAIGQTPKHLEHISSHSVIALVESWKRNGIKNKTICNRLAALRKLNRVKNLQISIPSNELLGVKSKRQTYDDLKRINAEEVLSKVSHPLSKMVLSWEVLFGFTRKEAAMIDLYTFYVEGENLLVVNDLCAHNKKSRMLPITTNEQMQAIVDRQKLLKGRPLLASLRYEDLLTLIRGELRIHGFSPRSALRMTYAQRRFDTLKQIMPVKQAKRKVIDEMGSHYWSDFKGVIQ